MFGIGLTFLVPYDIIQLITHIDRRKNLMGNFLLNARYMLAPILIVVAGAGVLIGGMAAWTGVILLLLKKAIKILLI